MFIRFACPHCSATLKVPGKAAGQRVPCPQCKLPLEVPTPKGELLPSAPVSVTAAPLTTAGPPAPSPFNFDGSETNPAADIDAPPQQSSRGYGVVALVWGVLGFLLFPPVGLIAIVIGKRVLREEPADRLARVGLIFGWIDMGWSFVWCFGVGALGWLLLGSGARPTALADNSEPVLVADAATPETSPTAETPPGETENPRTVLEKVQKIEQERRRLEELREQAKMERERVKLEQQKAAEDKARLLAEREAKLKKEAEDAARQEAEREVAKKEATATAKLKLAKRYFEDGNRDLGKKKLREILDQFPQTEAAKEAKELLDKM